MNSVPSGYQDLLQSFLHWRIFTMLGWQRIKGNYKRTVLGDFWVTINKSIHILTIGLVFSYVFQSPRADYIPHLALGTIFWAVIAGDLNTACRVFVMNAGTIKQVPLPLHLHLLQLYWQNLILLGHNLLLLPGIWWYVGIQPQTSMAMALLGLLLLQINLGWLGLLLSILCARFRDLEQIIANLLQVSYFLTPIMWTPERVLGRARLEVFWLQWDGTNWLWETYQLELLHFNPFYHLLELVRSPLLLQPVDQLHWWVAGWMAVLGWAIAAPVFQRTRSQIVYWL
jgi:lipopolysaccharide transport system permease protein